MGRPEWPELHPAALWFFQGVTRVGSSQRAPATGAGDGLEGLEEVGGRESATVLVCLPAGAARSQSLNNA